MSGIIQLKRVKSLREGRTAFSLVEVTLALAIMSFGVVSLVALAPVASKNLQRASDIGSSSLVAQSIATELMQKDYLEATSSASLAASYYDADGVQVANNAPTVVYEADLQIGAASANDCFTNSSTAIAQVNIWRANTNKTTQSPIRTCSFTILNNGL